MSSALSKESIKFFRHEILPTYNKPEEFYLREIFSCFCYINNFQKYLHRRSCVALEGTGCENNNAKCCRKGNPYTGVMRKCVNKGSFVEP